MKNEWLKGYACCLAVYIKMQGMVDTHAKELFGSGIGSLTLQDLIKSGVDEYDIEIFDFYWNDLHN